MARKKQRVSRRRRGDRQMLRGPGLTSRPGFWIIGLGVAFLVVGIGLLALTRQRAQGATLPTVEQLTISPG